MQQYRNNVQDQFGNVIANVTVTVNVRPGGGLADIFSDDGVTPKSNPFTNDSDSEFNFYAENGRYDIELTGPLTESISDIRLLDLPGASSSSFRIFTDIVTATPPTTEAVTGNFEIYDFDDTDQLMSLGFLGSNNLILRNYMQGGDVSLQATDAAGNVQNLIVADPDGTVDLYSGLNDVKRLGIQSNGRIELFSNTDTDAEDRYIAFSHQDGTDVARVGNIGGTTFYVRNRIHGGAILLQAEDIGGVNRTILDGDPDGETSLSYAGAKTFGNEAPGECVIYGDLDTAIDFRVLYGAFADGTHQWAVGQENGSDLALRNEIHGGIVHLSAEDSGGFVRFFLQGDPDGVTDIRGDTDVQILVNVGTELAVNAVANGAVSLYFNGLEYFRTQNRLNADVTSGAEVQDGNGVWQDVGFNVLGQILTNANYTIDRTECGYDIYKNASGAVTYTIPATAAAAQTDIPFGAVYEITNEDTEALTIDGTETGITLRWCPTGGTGDRTLAQWGIARLKKRSDSLWFITGVGIT